MEGEPRRAPRSPVLSSGYFVFDASIAFLYRAKFTSAASFDMPGTVVGADGDVGEDGMGGSWAVGTAPTNGPYSGDLGGTGAIRTPGEACGICPSDETPAETGAYAG